MSPGTAVEPGWWSLPRLGLARPSPFCRAAWIAARGAIPVAIVPSGACWPAARCSALQRREDPRRTGRAAL